MPSCSARPGSQSERLHATKPACRKGPRADDHLADLCLPTRSVRACGPEQQSPSLLYSFLFHRPSLRSAAQSGILRSSARIKPKGEFQPPRLSSCRTVCEVDAARGKAVFTSIVVKPPAPAVRSGNPFRPRESPPEDLFQRHDQHVRPDEAIAWLRGGVRLLRRVRRLIRILRS